MHDATEAPEVSVPAMEHEKVKKPVKVAPNRRVVAGKKPLPVGRRPLGIKTMSKVLQIRMTEEELSAVKAMGGSTWARGILEAALKRAASKGAKLPRAYLRYLEKSKK